MFNDFVGQPDSKQLVVLFRDVNSKDFRPMFHADDLKEAVDYVNEHRQSASGEYRIKDRKGNIA